MTTKRRLGRLDAWIAGGLLAACAALFAVPMAWPGLDGRLGNPSAHFAVVTVVAIIAFVLAVAVNVAARRLPDARTFFLALGFFSLATIFLAHGLGTSPVFQQGTTTHAHSGLRPPPPNATLHDYTLPSNAAAAPALVPGPAGNPVLTRTPEQIARSKVVGYSALMSVLVSSAFFALATRNWGERAAASIVHRRGRLTAGVVGVLATHMAVALWWPQTLAWIPMNEEPINWSLGGLSTFMLGIATWRFTQAYRIALLPIQGAMAVGMALLIEAQWMMLFGRLWQLSWWMYHVTMGAGFVTGVGALLVQYRMTGDLGAIVEGLFVRQQVSGIREGDPRALRALTTAVAARDTETAEHIARVAQLSVAMGKRLWLPGDRLQVLHWAGQLHDLGKIGVPGSILRKPGPLTRQELEVMKLHPVRGWEIARRSGLLAEAAPTIRAHHERLDGSGYPDGLLGDEISIEARIVAVADVWDALTCDRPYRKAMTEHEAAEILLRETGKGLDPRVVEELLRVTGLQQYLARVDAAAKRAA